MIPRYSRKEMEEIWEPKNKFQIWLDIECHACDKMADLGLIPKKSSENIRKKAKFDISRIEELELETKHDVVAFLKNLTENIGEDGKFLHQGMTSSDILDTTFSIQLKQASNIIIKDIEKLLISLKQKSLKHKLTPIMGRSHGIHAEKTTFGIKLAGYYAEFKRNLERMRLAQKEISTCTLPHEIYEIVSEVTETIPGKNLGIHAHNDTENAVANSLAALNAGARHVQGTINGLGERCGNTNLISLIPTLLLKTNFEIGIKKEKLKLLTKTSRLLDERLNRFSIRQAPYVGDYAFSHKGGLHVSAISKNPTTYEHIDPKTVGNNRNIVISDQAGRSNIQSQLNDIDIKVNNDVSKKILDIIKKKEFEGYSYDGALASFEILVRRELNQIKDYFVLNRFRVTDERRWNAKGKLITESEATINIVVNGEERMTVATGNGPVNALDSALRKGLVNFYPTIDNLRLSDYKVRIVSSDRGTGAITRVTIESTDEKNNYWSTVGVSTNIIDASYNAIHDSITYKLYHDLNAKK